MVSKDPDTSLRMGMFDIDSGDVDGVVMSEKVEDEENEVPLE